MNFREEEGPAQSGGPGSGLPPTAQQNRSLRPPLAASDSLSKLMAKRRGAMREGDAPDL